MYPSQVTIGNMANSLPAWLLLFALIVTLNGCRSSASLDPDSMQPSDSNATRETRALYRNLHQLSSSHVLLGHQDALAYGVHWKREEGRSDIKDITGSYPAVYGWELGDLEHGDSENLDGVRFDDMKKWIKEGYKRGGIITIGWHMDNPASGGDSWDPTRAIHTIIPGGEKHDLYVAWLDRFADFVSDLNVGTFKWLGIKKQIPIIFRPFHEHTGSWFWWGKDQITAEEYVTLWRFTVDYLRDEKGLHNLLYAYSTDIFEGEDEYFAHYPGDDYVDILGYDDYHSLKSEEGIQAMQRRLGFLVEEAEARNKIAALTETGFETIPMETWWTERLLPAIKDDPMSKKIAYVLLWRNANERPNHYYAPYPGHPSAPDFMRFYEDAFVLFESDLPNVYR